MEREVHGVLKCSVCGTIWDRDANASLNMLLKALFIIEERELPDCWQRGKEEAREKEKKEREQKRREADTDERRKEGK